MLLKLSMLVVALAFRDNVKHVVPVCHSGNISDIFLKMKDLFNSISAQVPQVGHAQW